jgi:hypothetical protein
MANISGVSHKKIRLKQTDPNQNKRILRAAEDFDADGIKHDRRLHIRHYSNMTIGEIAVQIRAFDYDIVVIDYINLLDKEIKRGENDASALGEISRIAKLQAGATNSAWVILAQLNEQGMVKYSRAIKENSDNLLSWTYGESEKESHVIEIHQQKARSSEAFTFNLKENFKIFRMEDAGNAEINADVKIRKSKRREQHPTAKPMPGLSFEEDGDDDL